MTKTYHFCLDPMARVLFLGQVGNHRLIGIVVIVGREGTVQLPNAFDIRHGSDHFVVFRATTLASAVTCDCSGLMYCRWAA